MKHLLNNLTEQEKNSIREQHSGGMKVVTENFSKLTNTKSGDVKTLVEQTTTGAAQTTRGTTPNPLKRVPDTLNYNVNGDEFMRYFEYLGGVKIVQKSPNETFIFKDKNGTIFSVSKEWVINEKNKQDQPEFLDPAGNGEVSDKFRYLFDNRIKF
jgi:hypothetical protein